MSFSAFHILLAIGLGLLMGLAGTLLIQRFTPRWNDRRFRLLAENAPGVIYLCRNDARYRMLFLSDAVETLTGYSKQEFLADRVSFVDLYHPDDAPEIRRQVDEALAERRPFRIQYRLRHRSGEWRWVDEAGAGLFRGDALEYLEGFLSDITQSRQTQEALRLSEEINRGLLESASGGIVFVRTDGRVVQANQAAQRILGLSVDQLLQRSIKDFRGETIDEEGKPLSPNDYPVSRCLRTGEPQPARTVGMRRPDGTIAWGIYTAVPYHDSRPDHPAGAIVTFLDVTELKNAQAELQASEERLRAIVENTPNVAIQGYNAQAEVLYWNPAAERIYGFSREEATGRPLSELILTDEGTQEFRDILAGMEATGRPAEPSEWEFHRKDGTSGVAYSTMFPIRGRDGSTQFVCMDVDITPLKEAEERARAAQQELYDRQLRETERIEAELARARDELIRQTELATIGKLSAQLAHDIRNPLASITNAVFLLRRKVSKDQTVCHEYLDMVQTETEVCDQIISGLLDVSKAWDPNPKEIDLGEMLRDLLARLDVPEGVTVSCDVRPEPYRIVVDPLHFRRVLDNLLHNALDAVQDSGAITIMARRSAEIVTLTIADTGGGIPPADRETIFEPFKTTKAKGTGLGLAICRQIISRHGGTIQVVDAPRGAAFEVQLPSPETPRLM